MYNTYLYIIFYYMHILVIWLVSIVFSITVVCNIVSLLYHSLSHRVYIENLWLVARRPLQLLILYYNTYYIITLAAMGIDNV